MNRPLPRLWLMLPIPEHLAERKDRLQGKAGAGKEHIRANMLAEPVGLRPGPGVIPGNDIGRRFALCIEQDPSLRNRCHGNGDDLARVCHLCDGPPDDVDDGAPKLVRPVVRPARTWHMGWCCGCGRCHSNTIWPVDDRLDSGRPDIQSEEQTHAEIIP